MRSELFPAFEKNNIPIVFASDEKFVPVMSVMIQSIIENASDENNYDIIILTRNISAAYEKILIGMAYNVTNFSIRVVNVSKEIEGYDFYTENRTTITIETYFRLLMPDLMENYRKALYLDGDMVANIDVAELYNIDLEEYLLASSRDCDGIGRYHKRGDDRKEYRDNVLKLKNPDNYFCAGTLVMNLEKFRKEMPTQKMLEFAISYPWQWHDQDVLNVLCEGKVKLVHMAWDVLRDAGNNRYMPAEFYAEFLESEKNPKIIHYGGMRKPWLYFDVERGEFFWKYAGKTPFYKQILSMVHDANSDRYLIKGTENNSSENGKRSLDVVLTYYQNGQAGFRYIWKYFKAWLKYKMKRK